MKFQIESRIIEIQENVKTFLLNYKQIGKEKERGGILLGQVFGKNKIIISRASIPTEFDKGSRFSFDRSKKSAQLFIDYEYENSGGTIIYLGEWHTHPENYPTPSIVDMKMIAQQYKENFINEDFLIMVIIGLKDNYFGFYDGKKLIQLSED